MAWEQGGSKIYQDGFKKRETPEEVGICALNLEEKEGYKKKGGGGRRRDKFGAKTLNR